jgi:hypothetical protein
LAASARTGSGLPVNACKSINTQQAIIKQLWLIDDCEIPAPLNAGPKREPNRRSVVCVI